MQLLFCFIDKECNRALVVLIQISSVALSRVISTVSTLRDFEGLHCKALYIHCVSTIIHSVQLYWLKSTVNLRVQLNLKHRADYRFL